MTGLNRAGYYRWRVPPPVLPVEMELRDEMQQIALQSTAYGYRRITAELNRRGFQVNHKRVLRLMHEDNLLCLRRKSFVVTTDSRHALPVYPNLARAITPSAVNQLWVADITYIRLRTDRVLTPELMAYPEWVRHEGIHGFAGHALVFREEILGVLGAFGRKPFFVEDFKWLRLFADHAAVSIANARAFEEISALHEQVKQENEYLRAEVNESFGGLLVHA
jgi:GAF domain-containing protein